MPLPRKPEAKDLGESKSQAVRRFLSLERSLHSEGKFKEVDGVIQEYFTLGHAEPTSIRPEQELSHIFYFQMHTVHKETSSSTKVHVMFDASAKSLTGVSLNDPSWLAPQSIHNDRCVA